MMNPIVQLKKASPRNVQARWVIVGDVQILFSYETPVAFRTRSRIFRVENHWGPATGRQMNEAGVRDWPVVDDERFNEELTEAIKDYFSRTDEP